METTRIVDAIKASNVKRVAFVDDAFDPPEIPESDWGELGTFMLKDNAEQIRTEAEITQNEWDAALEGLSNVGIEQVAEVVGKLYAAFVRTGDSKFDPMGRFDQASGANLAFVRPLLALVRQASPDVDIRTYGTQMDDVDAQDGPHVVFVDLFLSASVSPDKLPDPAEAQVAVQKSLDRIKPLLTLSPSVILMSSHPNADQVRDYRRQMEEESRVYASRFRFVSKKDVVQTSANDPVMVQPVASDTLLDLFQTYNFGRSLHHALDSWLKSAHDAISDLKRDMDELDLNDLAYLVRFRLADEGQSLPDYLEWLLGECLLDQVGRKLDDTRGVTTLDKEVKAIDGAFDGPTDKVADLYHRVRIENKRTRPREHFRLGDIYLRTPEKGDPHLIAIMNPDCDLVRRPKTGKPGAHAVLTLKGTLQNFNAPETAVGDFIVVDSKPHNIKWDYKHVETMPFSGVMGQPGHSDGEFKYLGALRPMYAQEIQANLMNQLGRVGVPVPPALAFSSAVSFRYSLSNGQVKTVEFGHDDTLGYFVPARQSDQEGKVVFRRQFVRKFVTELEAIDQQTLSQQSAGHVKGLLTPAGRAKLERLTSDGAVLEKDLGYGLLLTKKKPKLGEQNWGCVFVSMKKLEDQVDAVQEAEPPEAEAA